MAMKVDLLRVFNNTGAKHEFSGEIPMEVLEKCKGYTFAAPVKFSGLFYNRADVVNMDYSVDLTLNIVCDRCLKELKRDIKYDFRHIVVGSVNRDEEDFIVAEGHRVDVEEIALSDLLLELPTKMLCKEDCKGLCSVCGCDLNETECDCQK